MRNAARRGAGFTLIEILIVIVVLGIIAAVVVPQLTTAADDAKLDALKANLQLVRSQIELYRLHHNGQLPTSADLFDEQMTQYTNTSHGTSAAKTGSFVLGPYLMTVPDNPFTNTNDVTTTASGPAKAWYYNPATGEFRTNDGVHDGL